MNTMPAICNNFLATRTGQTGRRCSRLPFPAARETPCGFLPDPLPAVFTVILHKWPR